MTKRPMTNIEKVQHIMTYSRYGGLAQLFVMDALHKWTDIISKASPEEIGNGFVNGEAWIGVAREIQETLKSNLSTEDRDMDDTDEPSDAVRELLVVLEYAYDVLGKVYDGVPVDVGSALQPCADIIERVKGVEA